MLNSQLPSSKPFYSVKDVADILDRHPKTIRRWIEAGDLRAIKTGRDWRISRDDFRRFLKDGENTEIADVL